MKKVFNEKIGVSKMNGTVQANIQNQLKIKPQKQVKNINFKPLFPAFSSPGPSLFFVIRALRLSFHPISRFRSLASVLT